MRSSRGIRTRRATSRTVGAGVVGVAVIGVVLAGCTTEPGPEPSAPETTAATTTEPTATPTPTESVPPETVKPERPEAMDEVSVEGAEAVARYFMTLHAYAFATGDVTELKPLSDPGCNFCASVIESIEEVGEAGQKVTGGGLEIHESTAREIAAGDTYSAEVRGTQLPWQVRDAAGGVVDEQTEKQDHTFYFALRWSGDGWIIRGVQVDDPPA